MIDSPLLKYTLVLFVLFTMSFSLKVDSEAENDFEFVRNLAIFRIRIAQGLRLGLKSICSLVFSYITHETPTIAFDKLYGICESCA